MNEDSISRFNSVVGAYSATKRYGTGYKANAIGLAQELLRTQDEDEVVTTFASAMGGHCVDGVSDGSLESFSVDDSTSPMTAQRSVLESIAISVRAAALAQDADEAGAQRVREEAERLMKELDAESSGVDPAEVDAVRARWTPTLTRLVQDAASAPTVDAEAIIVSDDPAVSLGNTQTQEAYTVRPSCARRWPVRVGERAVSPEVVAQQPDPQDEAVDDDVLDVLDGEIVEDDDLELGPDDVTAQARFTLDDVPDATGAPRRGRFKPYKLPLGERVHDLHDSRDEALRDAREESTREIYESTDWASLSDAEQVNRLREAFKLNDGDYMRMVRESHLFEGDREHKRRELNGIHKAYVGMMVVGCVTPLKRGVSADTIGEVIGMGATLWLLSPEFRQQIGDVTTSALDSWADRQIEHKQARIDRRNERGREATERMNERGRAREGDAWIDRTWKDEELSERWLKRRMKLKDKKAEQFGEYPMTTRSAALTEVALGQKAYQDMRVEGCDPEKVLESYNEAMDVLYEEAQRWHISPEALATESRHVVSEMVAADPTTASMYEQMAYGQFQQDSSGSRVVRDAEGRIRREHTWTGNFTDDHGNVVDRGSFTPRMPDADDEYEAAMLGVITKDLQSCDSAAELATHLSTMIAAASEAMVDAEDGQTDATGDVGGALHDSGRLTVDGADDNHSLANQIQTVMMAGVQDGRSAHSVYDTFVRQFQDAAATTMMLTPSGQELWSEVGPRFDEMSQSLRSTPYEQLRDIFAEEGFNHGGLAEEYEVLEDEILIRNPDGVVEEDSMEKARRRAEHARRERMRETIDVGEATIRIRNNGGAPEPSASDDQASL